MRNKSMWILVWEASSNTSLSCFIRKLHTRENNKNLGANSLDCRSFLVFRTTDETLKLVFELLHQNLDTFPGNSVLFTGCAIPCIVIKVEIVGKKGYAYF